MPTKEIKVHIDPERFDMNQGELKKKMDEIFEASKRAKNREVIKNFIDEMNNDIIPEVDLAVNSLIHTYAYRNEIEAVKMIWRCFEQVVALDDPKVNAIIALEIQELKKRQGKE